MTDYRLNDIAPDLVAWGKRLSPDARRQIARSVAEWACRQTGADENGTVWTRVDRAHLTLVVQNYDHEYFLIYAANDEQFDRAGTALSWFRKARAVASLLYALDAEQESSFFDALYEAKAAVGNLDALRAHVFNRPVTWS